MDHTAAIPKLSNHSSYPSDISEISCFSFMGDTPFPCASHLALGPNSCPTAEYSDHSGLQADAAGLDHCWPRSGWENVSSSTESSDNNEVDRSNGPLCRAWDWWANPSPFHGRSNRQPFVNEWEIHDEDMAMGDNKTASKDSISASSCSETGSISLASSVSDIVGARHVQEFGLGMLSDQKAPSFDQDQKARSGGIQPAALANESQAKLGSQNAREEQIKVAEKHGTNSSMFSLDGNAKVVKEERVTEDEGLTSSIGLKLGKRTYFEDASASGSSKKAPAPSSTALGNKPKPGAQPPRCQAEGCKMDLSNARDYHRRHKVCAWHSKASKVKVGDSDQRFCQQCSRFHVLGEFDEDKRSCRRRLAGHNERRRKPQPEMIPSFTGGICSFLADGRHPCSGFMQHPYFMPHNQASMLCSALDHSSLTYASHANIPSFNSTLQPTSDQGLVLLQGAQTVGNYWTHKPPRPMHESICTLGEGLPLKLPMVQSSLEVLPASQSLSEVSDSGRALSLLSSWGSPNYFCPTTLDISANTNSSSGSSSHNPMFLEQFFGATPVITSQQVITSSPSSEGQNASSQNSGKGIASDSASQNLASFFRLLG